MITFIESGNRIATENFEIGEIYTITFTNGNYKTMCCAGIGVDFVMFQDKLPNALFCLTMGTSDTVLSIDLGGGGSGTMNYNELENKPQINGIVLIGNKTSSDLNLVSQSELEDYATNASVVSALASKQDTLTTPQLNAVNSGITSLLVNQITTNKNNISKFTPIDGSITWNTSAIGSEPSINTKYIMQQGNIVNIQLYIEFATALTVNTETVIGVLTGVIFPKNIYRGFVMQGADYFSSVMTPCYIAIGTTGNVVIKPPTGATNKKYLINITYHNH